MRKEREMNKYYKVAADQPYHITGRSGNLKGQVVI